MRLLPIEYSVRNLGRSPLRLALSLAGAFLVAGLALAAGGFVSGMERSLRATGSEHNVILLGAGSEESVQRSEIGAGVAGLVAASVPGIRTSAGVAHVSAETHIDLPVGREADAPSGATVLIRGVTPAATLVHAQVQIVEGGFPEAGRNELLVGALVHARLGARERDLALGQSLWIDDEPWTIVGRFIAPGTAMEAEIWTSNNDLKVSARRDTDSCIVLTLEGAEFADVDAFCKRRLDLELVAMRETDYYGALAAFYAPVRTVAWATAALIGLGGLFGGLNTMYAAFAARIRELGMLQCLGYRRLAIVISLAQESILVAAAGSLAACALALWLLDGVAVRFSMGAFGMVVDAPVVAIGLGAGLLLGLVGALPPAWRSLRMPIPESLKSL